MLLFTDRVEIDECGNVHYPPMQAFLELRHAVLPLTH